MSRSKSRSQPKPAPAPKEPERAPEKDPDNPGAPTATPAPEKKKAEPTGPTAVPEGAGGASAKINADVTDRTTIRGFRRRARVLGAASQQLGL